MAAKELSVWVCARSLRGSGNFGSRVPGWGIRRHTRNNTHTAVRPTRRENFMTPAVGFWRHPCAQSEDWPEHKGCEHENFPMPHGEELRRLASHV